VALADELAWGGLVPTLALLELTPGPNLAYLAITSATTGRRAGLAATAGVALGLGVLAVAAGLGLAPLLRGSPTLATVLRWGGVAYLVALAAEAWGRAPAAVGAPPQPWWRYLWRGLVSNLLSPKSMLVFVAVLPAFVVDTPPSGHGLALASAVYVGMATAVHLIVVAAAGALHGWLAAPARRARAQRVAAVLLVGAAAWLAWSTRGPW
jgi:threonine/homoserine/homoserine lactone efflux protein